MLLPKEQILDVDMLRTFVFNNWGDIFELGIGTMCFLLKQQEQCKYKSPQFNKLLYIQTPHRCL